MSNICKIVPKFSSQGVDFERICLLLTRYSAMKASWPINWVIIELVPDILENNSILMWLIA
jgi:hypothetical protein